MQDSDIPAKFPIPWGNSAGAGFIRPIPTASQVGIQNGAASLETGFPPLNSLPLASGGVPPFMQDHNGILNEITAWSRWAQAGGPLYYDSTFAADIGGYPKGAQLMSSVTNGLIWINQVDNNTTNPDSGGSNWTSIYAQAHTWSATQTFSTGAISTSFDSGGANFRAVGGSYGAMLRNDGTNVLLLQTASGSPNGSFNSFTPFAWNLSTGAVTIDGTGRGASFGGNVTAGGGINSSTGTVTNGAKGSGNGTRVVSLNDFSGDFSSFFELPNGAIVQMGVGIVVAAGGGTTNTLANLPIAFPNQCAFVLANFGGTSPPANGSCAAQPATGNKSQIEVSVAVPSAGSYGVVFIAFGN